MKYSLGLMLVIVVVGAIIGMYFPWYAMGISAAVAAAIISNNRGSSFDVTKPISFRCNPEDGAPVNGVCTNNSSTVTVTGTGTNTSTTTVPVVTTYVAIPVQ